MPGGLKNWLKTTFPQTERKVSSMLILSDIDWGQTSAYAMELRANIWINLKGREPQGTVEPGQEYEALRDEIIEKLHDWQDPFTQEMVVERVFKREELFDGPHFDKTPDLLILYRLQRGYGYNHRQGVLSQRRQSIEVLTDKELRDSARPNANHSLNGICLLRGPNIAAGASLRDAEIKDVAPTILYLMGEPIPDDMDGRVLTEALEPDYLTANPIEITAAEDDPRDPNLVAYNDREHQTVQERLRELGYID
jgi:predicted AlkP superfamily phosphohydrolase/phosphomutase